MILALTILAGIGFVFSIIDSIHNKDSLVGNIFLATIFVILCWNTHLTLSIITIIVWFILAAINYILKSI